MRAALSWKQQKPLIRLDKKAIRGYCACVANCTPTSGDVNRLPATLVCAFSFVLVHRCVPAAAWQCSLTSTLVLRYTHGRMQQTAAQFKGNAALYVFAVYVMYMCFVCGAPLASSDCCISSTAAHSGGAKAANLVATNKRCYIVNIWFLLIPMIGLLLLLYPCDFAVFARVVGLVLPALYRKNWPTIAAWGLIPSRRCRPLSLP